MSATVLIVDDEPAQLELLRYNLQQAGFETLQADNEAAALDMIEASKPDLLVIDWMMPESSGIDVCRQLRSRKETKNLPIIMLSARGEEGDRSLGLDTGADDYVTKPFSPRELVSRVNALLRRSRPALLQEVLEYEDVVLNPETMQVMRGGDPGAFGTEGIPPAGPADGTAGPRVQPRAIARPCLGPRHLCRRPHGRRAYMRAAPRPQQNRRRISRPPRPHPHRARHRLRPRLDLRIRALPDSVLAACGAFPACLCCADI